MSVNNIMSFARKHKSKTVVSFDRCYHQNCDRLSQLYIEEIRGLMCKFGGYDYTILLQYARVIMSRGWNYEHLFYAVPLLMHKKNGLLGNNFEP